MPETTTAGQVFESWAEFDAHGPGAMKWEDGPHGQQMLYFTTPDGVTREVFAAYEGSDPLAPGHKRRAAQDLAVPSFGQLKLKLDGWEGRITSGSIITIT